MKFFGTDGIRTKLGIEPLNLNISNLAHAIATWIQSYKTNNKNKKILIAHDTRNSSCWIKSELKSKLLLYPNTIYDYAVLPTPIAFHLVSKKKLFDIAIIITASHNPFYDNGLKIITQYGKLSDKDELSIEKILEKKEFAAIEFQNMGIEKTSKTDVKIYIDDLLNQFKKDFLKGKKIVLDCANGSTQTIAPKIFNKFGIKLKIINNRANGFNINNKCGSTDTSELQKAVLKYKADFGIAFDGDGDRVTIINCYGESKDGDDIIQILSEHPNYKTQKNIVGTIMSNESLAKYFDSKKKYLIRADVGDKNVLKQMLETNSILGAEPSGHIILKDFLDCSDGIFAALKTLESAILNNNLELQSTKKFPSISKNIKFKYKHNLSKEPLKSIIENFKKNVSRIVIRYSGTEPYLRILIEDKDLYKANKVMDYFIKELSVYLNNKNILKPAKSINQNSSQKYGI
jgi:phosphoglucosamine mutase